MVLWMIYVMIAPVYASNIAIIDNVMIKEKVIALTLEDVESAAQLEEVITLCKENNVHVSFFCPSYFVTSQQEIVKQAIAEGHEFGNCGVKPVYWDELREEDITKEFRVADLALQTVLHVQVSIVKPAYSQYEDKFFSAIAAFNPNTVVIRGSTIESGMIEAKVMAIMSGNIIAISMKDKDLLESLSELVSVLKNRGYRIVTVSELLCKGSNSYINKEFCKKKEF